MTQPRTAKYGFSKKICPSCKLTMANTIDYKTGKKYVKTYTSPHGNQICGSCKGKLATFYRRELNTMPVEELWRKLRIEV